MRAVVCRELGLPEVLVVEDVPDPVASPGRVVVDVEAAGVNFVDALFISGEYQIKPQLPFTPGNEVAGTVRTLGEGVSSVATGDRVLVSVGLGGFASAVAAAEHQLMAIPPNMDAARAATFTQSYCTALFALRRRARVQSGERVLVLGAGGGVGLAAVDVARWLGCEAIGAASTEEKRTAALSAGATRVVDSSVPALKYRDVTDWVDVVLDPVGGEHSVSALRALREGGRLVVIGFASGAIPSIPANHVLLRNREVIGVDWGAWAMSHDAEQRSMLGELLGAVAGGQLHPVSPVRYALDDVVLALNALMSRGVTGKVALIP